MRRALLLGVGVVFAAASSGCGEIILRARIPDSEHVPSTSTHPATGYTPVMAKGGDGGGGGGDHGAEIVIPPLDGPLPLDAARIQVFASKHIAALTEVVGVLDMHTSADSEDKGFDLLRMRALQLGADAVIGAEFEHGEGSEPSHLSGMAVRYVR